jgi:uncharacterized protein (DUF362 family)
MSRVAVVRYSGGGPGRLLTETEYRLLLTTGLALLGGDARAYLKSLFPKGVIGMKTNCLARENATAPALVDALSVLLKQAAGVADNDLVVWERTNRELKNAGYTLNASSFGRRCLGTDTSDVGYDDAEFFTAGKASSLVTRILTQLVDHNINLGVLKDHSVAGMSGGLKNMYGAVHNPNKYHGDHCSPYAADVSRLAPIRNKQRLTIIDAVRVQYDKGPGFNEKYLDFHYSLVLSADPVAADRVALEILEHFRAKHQLPSLVKAGRPVNYLIAGEQSGLGIADLVKVDLQVMAVDAGGTATKGELF